MNLLEIRLMSQPAPAVRTAALPLFLLLALACVTRLPAQGIIDVPLVPYRNGIGTPVNDHQLLTVAHLGYDAATGIKDPLTDLLLVNYPAGSFSSWAEISYDWGPVPGDTVLVANRHTVPGQITFAEHTVFGYSGERFLVTEPSLAGGDSGGGVFDAAGRLVGVNYAIDTRGRSYHYRPDYREDWLRANIAPPLSVPEPAIGWLLSVGLLAFLFTRRLTWR